MLTIKEAKKIPFAELDEETKEYMYDLFKRYVVRKKIADTNKELSSLFTKRLGFGSKDYSKCFNEFNSRFVNTDLIRCLNYNEVHTNFLKKMTEVQFNDYLSRTGRSFDRKIALICFSSRASERIANRVSFPVMVAYADMQDLVIEKMKKEPDKSLNKVFVESAKIVRGEFYNMTGKRINDTLVVGQRTDYKSIGKKCAPIWKKMLEFYKSGLDKVDPIQAVNFVRENFVFTSAERRQFGIIVSEAMQDAMLSIENDQKFLTKYMEENPDEYIPADVDETFSKRYMEEIYYSKLKNPINSVFENLLADSIYLESESKKKLQ